MRPYAIPRYYRDDAARGLRKDFTPVRWEYEVDAEATDPGERDKGFVKARTCAPRTRYEKKHGDRAGLFRIDDFRELVTLMHATLGDASAEVTFFALAQDARFEDLRAHMDHLRPPALATLLGPGDLFIDLTIGVDLGHYDSLLIVSTDDLGDRLDRLAERCERAVALYESRVDRTRTVEAMLDELAALVAADA